MGAENPETMCARRRGCTSNIIHRLLRWLNYTVIAASIISIICMLVLRLVPTAWGWAFLSFSFLCIASAIAGCISTTSMASGGGCYSLHMFLLITSSCTQGSVFLLLITRPDAVLDKFQSNRSEYDGRVLLKVDAALLLWCFCVQMVVLATACTVHYCEPVDYYEDLEGNARHRSSRRLSRVQEESIADAQAAAAEKERVEKKEESKATSGAARLHREMKEKYGVKKSEEMQAFDNVEI